MTTALNPTPNTPEADHVVTLDEDTPDYYGSDVSSVSNIPDGFNEISREDEYEESDTGSATDGLPEGFNDPTPEDHIGPDPDAIMQSVGEGGGGDAAAEGALTDVHDAQSAYAADAEASPKASKGSSRSSKTNAGGEPAPADDDSSASVTGSGSVGTDA